MCSKETYFNIKEGVSYMRVARCFVLCLLLGLVLVACGDSDPVATFPEKDTLTIMTYNIEDCDKGGTDTSFSVYESITSLVKNEGVDVVCFQEVQPGSATDDLTGMDQSLLTEM